MVTVIYPIKDKEPKRLVNSVRSLKENTTQDVTFIVVDYGSSKKYTSGLRKVCKEENLRLIRVESQGLPWNKAHALNIGVEATDSEFIALVDVDIVFEDDVIGFSMKYYSENSVIHGQIYLLPKTGIKKFGKPCSPPAAGAYIFLKRKDFLDVDGFDERVNFWGHEDFDLNEKFRQKGMREVFIKDFYLYHVWHPISNSFLSDRPEFSMSETLRATMENRVGLKDIPIGKNIKKEDRPILNKIENSKPRIIEIKNYEKQIGEILETKKKDPFIRLVFPRRRRIIFFGHKIIDSLSLFLNKTILSTLGYQIVLQKDNNFDLFYHSLPILRNVGLKDYYLYDGYEQVDILF